MNKYHWLWFIIVLINLSCESENNSDKAIAELLIFPSGGGELGYLINIHEDSATVFKKRLALPNADSILGEKMLRHEIIVFSKSQKEKIKNILAGLD